MLFWGCNLLLALGAIPPAALAYTFVNPAIHGGQTSFAHNTVYEEKSVLEVQWTQGETDEDATVALWQVNQSTSLSAPETIGDLEYIAEGQAWDRTSRRWIVITNKDLPVSPVFMMMLFVTGATIASDETMFFNISSADSANTAASVSASATTVASTSIPSSAYSPSTSVTASGLSSASSTESTGSSTLPTSAKSGMGVGIPSAAIIGFMAGWLAFRHQKAYNQSSLEAQQLETNAMGTNGITAATLSGLTATTPKEATIVTPSESTAATYRPASSLVYEASNEAIAPIELYAPYDRIHTWTRNT